MKTRTKNSRDYGGHAHKNTRKQNLNISTDTAVFLNQKRANVCEYTMKMASLEFWKCATRGLIILIIALYKISNLIYSLFCSAIIW